MLNLKKQKKIKQQIRYPSTSINVLSLSRSDSLNNTLQAINLQKLTTGRTNNSKQENFNNANVPIYQISYQTVSFKTSLQHSTQSYQGDKNETFAYGSLIGKFYEFQKVCRINKAIFVGDFKGVVQCNESDGQIYFQGSISNIYIIKDSSWRNDAFLQAIAEESTFFKGYFKGYFYKWSEVGFDNLSISHHTLSNASGSSLLLQKNCNEELMDSWKVKRYQPQYFLPTVVRFQVQDFRQINLEKSLAIVSGFLYIQIRYNQTIKQLIKQTIQLKKQQSKQGQRQNKYQTLLQIVLNFHRDFSLLLNLDKIDMPDSDSYDEQQSSGSEWSIMDKTWDIQFQDDKQTKTFRFRVWKCFKAQIDNSYGSFFAPFNLSILRIVVSVHHFLVKNRYGDKFRMHLVCTDLLDYDCNDKYNPFVSFNDLNGGLGNSQHLNRIHKININRFKGRNSFIVADNRLTLFPYFKNILVNKNNANSRMQWGFGLADKYAEFKDPIVRSIEESFMDFNKKTEQQLQEQFEIFAFQTWNYTIIEIPIYKYVIIDMIQIFVPLTLLSIMSLFIFNQENGVSPSTGLTTLAYRLLNIASIMIAYVSLIPVMRSNLPPMPNITLIEIITYAETIPNLLSILNSMLYYTISSSDWKGRYQSFQDGVFQLSLLISLFNLVVLIVVFIVYTLAEYNMKNIDLPKPDSQTYQDRSPMFLRFIKNLQNKRKEYSIRTIID